MKNIILYLFIFSTFLLSSCSDSCDDANCLHNGFCESNECVCTEQYTGKNCELEVEPLSVKLQSFIINIYEIKPNGDPWDDEPGIEAMPDVYIKILDSSNNVFQTTEMFPTPNVAQSILSFEVEITDVSESFTLLVFDEDGDIDDLVYEFPFQPYIEGDGFPSSITKIYNAINIPPMENGELTINKSYCF